MSHIPLAYEWQLYKKALAQNIRDVQAVGVNVYDEIKDICGQEAVRFRVADDITLIIANRHMPDGPAVHVELHGKNSTWYFTEGHADHILDTDFTEPLYVLKQWVWTLNGLTEQTLVDAWSNMQQPDAPNESTE